MRSVRHRDFRVDVWSVALLLPLLAVPLLTVDPLFNSLTSQVAIGISAAMAIYIMLRLGLLSFMVPAFMAIGGYTGAILAKAGVTDLAALVVATSLVPALFAVPLGLLVLRLQGIYFIFITFLFNEILQLVIFETPGLTGGSNGISGVPSATFLGRHLDGAQTLVLVTVIICLVASLLTLWVTQRFRAEFTSIQENETLTESFGIAIWKYRTIGFVASAAVAGLAGFALVNTLATAHPSSFASWSVNNYIAYAFVGGRSSMMGMVVGSALLIVMTNVFSAYAQFSAAMYGILVIVVMMAFPGGIVGTAVKVFDERRARRLRPVTNLAAGKSA